MPLSMGTHALNPNSPNSNRFPCIFTGILDAANELDGEGYLAGKAQPGQPTGTALNEATAVIHTVAQLALSLFCSRNDLSFCFTPNGRRGERSS